MREREKEGGEVGGKVEGKEGGKREMERGRKKKKEGEQEEEEKKEKMYIYYGIKLNILKEKFLQAHTNKNPIHTFIYNFLSNENDAYYSRLKQKNVISVDRRCISTNWLHRV